MELNRTSGLKLYSLGIVTEDKPYGTDVAKVCPIEEFSLEEGKLEEDTRELESSLPDINGVVKTAKIKGSAILEAKWIPWGNSNRDTSPDVKKSETVLIYRYADTHDYYWDTVFREPELRRLEHVRHAYSNKPSGIEAYDSDTSYWVEYSTSEKRIKLHTSDNDGEACTYDIQINTKDGIVRIEDSIGNFIELNSPDGMLHTQTNKEIWHKTELFRVDANIVSTSDTIQRETGSYVLNSTGVSTVNTGSSQLNASGTVDTTAKDYNLTTDDKIKIDTNRYELTARSALAIGGGASGLAVGDNFDIMSQGNIKAETENGEILNKAKVIKTSGDLASKSAIVERQFTSEEKTGGSIKYKCSEVIYLEAPMIVLQGTVYAKDLIVQNDIIGDRVYADIEAKDNTNRTTPSYSWNPTYEVDN